MSQFDENRKKVFGRKLKELIDKWAKTNGVRNRHDTLAAEFHVARETISAWANGRNLPSDETIKEICKFFSVTPNYFDPDLSVNEGKVENDLILADKEYHIQMAKDCELTAKEIGLEPSLLELLKTSPQISDRIMSVSWVDAYAQPFELEREVPDNPDEKLRCYQFVSSVGQKVYVPDEVLYMLRVVQRDLLEYAGFLVDKWSKVIEDYHNGGRHIEGNHGQYTVRNSKGEEHVSAIQRFAYELQGRGSLTPGACHLVDMYKLMPADDQEKLLSDTQHSLNESRKKRRRSEEKG